MQSGSSDRVDGWCVAKRGALMTIGSVAGDAVTAAAATALGRRLNAWARDPELYAVTLDDSLLALGVADVAAGAEAALAELAWRLECFSKPTVSLMSGTVGEVGLALALAGTHQAADPGARLAMQSLTMGRLPPGTLIAAMARAGMGDAHALDGNRWRRLLSHEIGEGQTQAILDGLADAEPVDPLLDERAAARSPAVDNGAADGEQTRTAAAAALQGALAKARGQTIDQTLTLVYSLDQALATLPTDAAFDEVLAAAGKHPLALPSRRALQAFRKDGGAQAAF